jgi:hypothetical protein
LELYEIDDPMIVAMEQHFKGQISGVTLRQIRKDALQYHQNKTNIEVK